MLAPVLLFVALHLLWLQSSTRILRMLASPSSIARVILWRLQSSTRILRMLAVHACGPPSAYDDRLQSSTRILRMLAGT